MATVKKRDKFKKIDAEREREIKKERE